MLLLIAFALSRVMPCWAWTIVMVAVPLWVAGFLLIYVRTWINDDSTSDVDKKI